MLSRLICYLFGHREEAEDMGGNIVHWCTRCKKTLRETDYLTGSRSIQVTVDRPVQVRLDGLITDERRIDPQPREMNFEVKTKPIADHTADILPDMIGYLPPCSSFTFIELPWQMTPAEPDCFIDPDKLAAERLRKTDPTSFVAPKVDLIEFPIMPDTSPAALRPDEPPVELKAEEPVKVSEEVGSRLRAFWHAQQKELSESISGPSDPPVVEASDPCSSSDSASDSGSSGDE